MAMARIFETLSGLDGSLLKAKIGADRGSAWTSFTLGSRLHEMASRKRQQSFLPPHLSQ